MVYGNWCCFEVGVIVTLMMELSQNNLNKRRVNWKDIVYRYNELYAYSLTLVIETSHEEIMFND